MTKRILFLCIENSNRSQMAEAFGRMNAPKGVEVFSAGSAPSGKVNPKAVAAMAELGYDMSQHRSKGLRDLPPGVFDVAVTMGCGDACPATLAKRRIDWQIPDPKHLSECDYRQVRDLLGRMVRALVEECVAAK
jgi:protein-tyrosine-phosphatase